jgi:hypothetical protein
MCTLILGVDVTGAETIIVGANRVEDSPRASDAPRVLRPEPDLTPLLSAAPHVPEQA